MPHPRSDFSGFLPDGQERLLKGIRQNLKESLVRISTCGLSEPEKQLAKTEAEGHAAELEKRLDNPLNHY